MSLNLTTHILWTIFPCHCRCSCDESLMVPGNPAVETRAREVHSGPRAADLVPSATCHGSQREGYGPLGTSQEMNSSPAACCGWIDLQFNYSCSWCFMDCYRVRPCRNSCKKFGSRIEVSGLDCIIRLLLKKGHSRCSVEREICKGRSWWGYCRTPSPPKECGLREFELPLLKSTDASLCLREPSRVKLYFQEGER